jgi:hypothetical protein
MVSYWISTVHPITMVQSKKVLQISQNKKTKRIDTIQTIRAIFYILG